MLNRRSFLKKAITAAAFIPIIPSLVPLVEAAKEKEQEDEFKDHYSSLSQVINEDATGGYIVPSQYVEEMAELIRKESVLKAGLWK